MKGQTTLEATYLPSLSLTKLFLLWLALTCIGLYNSPQYGLVGFIVGGLFVAGTTHLHGKGQQRLRTFRPPDEGVVTVICCLQQLTGVQEKVWFYAGHGNRQIPLPNTVSRVTDMFTLYHRQEFLAISSQPDFSVGKLLVGDVGLFVNFVKNHPHLLLPNGALDRNRTTALLTDIYRKAYWGPISDVSRKEAGSTAVAAWGFKVEEVVF